MNQHDLVKLFCNSSGIGSLPHMRSHAGDTVAAEHARALLLVSLPAARFGIHEAIRGSGLSIPTSATARFFALAKDGHGESRYVPCGVAMSKLAAFCGKPQQSGHSVCNYSDEDALLWA